MSTQIELKIMELLTSKVCHDLISPIGAINNGMEFVEEMGADAGEEVFDLIGFSAHQASAKLQAYRMAYGVGGGDTSIKPEDVHKAIQAMVEKDGKITQDWDPYAPLGPEERPGGFAKMLVCGFLLAIDSLPKGGKISAANDESGIIVITATGENCNPRNDMESCLALSFDQDQLEPKHIHATVTALAAKAYGYDVTLEHNGADSISFFITCP